MLSIHKAGRNIKRRLRYIPFDLFVAILVCLIGFISFLLGWVAHSEYEREPVQAGTITLPMAGGNGVFVGSRNSDKYHYRWCSGAQRITVDNRIYFETRAAAAAAGYTPARNCPGLTTDEE